MIGAVMIMIIFSPSWRWRREFTCTHCVTHLDRVRMFNYLILTVQCRYSTRGSGYTLSAMSNLNCVSVESLQPNPSLLAAFYDYAKLMPMVTEANQMSQELNKASSSSVHQLCPVMSVGPLSFTLH